MAWTYRAGCKGTPDSPDTIPGPFMGCIHVCGEHQRQHLVHWPHSYAIPPSFETEDFWVFRREIQRQQSIVDAEQDKAEQGFLKRSMIQTIAPVLRDIFPLGNVHGFLMFDPLMFEIGVPEYAGRSAACIALYRY